MKNPMQHPNTERITVEQWKRTHRDFKTTINGQRYVLRWTTQGTGLVPVVIVKENKQ